MINMNNFFPNGWAHYLFGGLLIGLGVSLMFVVQGRVVGMSSVFTSTWSYVSKRAHFQQTRFTQTRQWRLICALGLILGAFIWFLLLGGLLAGFGARLSNGCTSGHGICGLSSLSGSALVAVLIFMSVAMATALSLSWFSGVMP